LVLGVSPASNIVMKRISAAILALFLVTTLVFAEEDVKVAKVLAVKEYDHGRIAFWEGRTPIYDDYPFYDITLSLEKKKYVVRYESVTGYYPSRWKVGSEVNVRLQGKGKMYLLNGAEEVPVGIFNTRAQECVSPIGPSVVQSPGPQVPCQ
jgi:hypothetical protein